LLGKSFVYIASLVWNINVSNNNIKLGTIKFLYFLYFGSKKGNNDKVQAVSGFKCVAPSLEFYSIEIISFLIENQKQFCFIY